MRHGATGWSVGAQKEKSPAREGQGVMSCIGHEFVGGSAVTDALGGIVGDGFGSPINAWRDGYTVEGTSIWENRSHGDIEFDVGQPS